MSGLRRVQVTGGRFDPHLPEGATYCGRNRPYLKRSKYANPFTERSFGLEECLRLYRLYLTGTLPDPSILLRLPNRKWADRLYREGNLLKEAVAELSGDLACSCPLGQPCHVDVLIELIGDAE
jgi:hypothetical protein